MFLGPVEGNLCNMIFDFDRNSVIHSLLPQRRAHSGSQSTSASRLFGFIVWISLVFAYSPTIASEYPEPGIFEVVKSDSEIRVLVYRGGLFGGFGHNHVISTSDIAGRIKIAEDPAASSVELTIPVESFEIDVASIRLEEGESFKKEVSDKDKRGTRKNMLGEKLLDGAKFSNITIRSQSWTGEIPDILAASEITVRDQINSLELPTSVSVSDEQIFLTGRFAVTHKQLGLKPFTAVLGALRVRDEMEIKFRITARRVTD